MPRHSPTANVVAVILAAGLGPRPGLRHGPAPPCLLRVRGRTILGNALTSLEKTGVDDVVLVVGDGADRLRRFVAEWFPRTRARFVTHHAGDTIGPVLSLRHGLAAVPGGRALLLLAGNVFFDPELVAEFLRLCDGPAVIVVPSRPDHPGTVPIGFFPWPDVGETLRPALDQCLVEEGPRAAFPCALSRYAVNAEIRVATLGGERRWFEINTLEDLRSAESNFARPRTCYHR